MFSLYMLLSTNTKNTNYTNNFIFLMEKKRPLSWGLKLQRLEYAKVSYINILKQLLTMLILAPFLHLLDFHFLCKWYVNSIPKFEINPIFNPNFTTIWRMKKINHQKSLIPYTPIPALQRFQHICYCCLPFYFIFYILIIQLLAIAG